LQPQQGVLQKGVVVHQADELLGVQLAWGSGLRYCSYWGVGYWGIGLTGWGVSYSSQLKQLYRAVSHRPVSE
jgi:hypothetical protein